MLSIPGFVQLQLPWTRFKALADWYPCPTHTEEDPEFDMHTFYWRAVMHTNSMTQQNPWLDECSQEDPNVYAIQMHVDIAKEKGIEDGDKAELSTRRGKVTATAVVTERSPRGTVFMPFHYREAPANMLTNPALDPIAKIPELKVCAVKVRRIGAPAAAETT